ncbi:hypothetical protein BJV78DRAFT_1204159, partial [Lactifluus subvellereus]
IFHFHALDEPSWSNRRTFGWIKATHVALEDSSLWARFSGFPPSTCLAEILARAKDAPLVIDFDGPHNSKTFFIQVDPVWLFGCRNIIHELCNLEAPMLEHFELGFLLFLLKLLLGQDSSRGKHQSYGPSRSAKFRSLGHLFRVLSYLSWDCPIQRDIHHQQYSTT